MAMHPLVALVIAKILDYLAEHADDMVRAIREKFSDAMAKPEIVAAVQELGYEPSEEKLHKLSDVLAKHDKDAPKQLASLLVERTLA